MTALNPVSRTRMAPNGPEVSRLIAGFWRLKHWGMSTQARLSFIEQLLELGITTMDHAMVYGSEGLFGEALALRPSLRSQMQIVTKCGIRPCGFGPLGAQKVNHYDASAAAIVQSVDNSLSALGTDYMDLLLIHRPDYLLQVDEVAACFAALKAAGKVKYFGVSNFTPSQFASLQMACGGSLVTNQIELSPLQMAPLDNGLLDQCVQQKIKPMAWSCLAGGALLAPTEPRGERVLAALNEVAEELGLVDIEPVVYAWVMTLPCDPLPLLGSSKIERIKIAVQADALRLSREQWYRIWEASNGACVP
ncbi:MAG TPA: aldo/keto reductase [Cellvibrionaceae bacterium]|nr:aldo/keto reductase [Cellvibrionaceae bacterium]HMW71234.1 aldo/keto reductase [Cellvibrionaceae bacterium]HMY37934.1 aldo/keto reductase [Marinagarivorans sp.]HNG58252.1 aldo/keto reductase [Cellvibrionaceae bacterium]